MKFSPNCEKLLCNICALQKLHHKILKTDWGEKVKEKWKILNGGRSHALWYEDHAYLVMTMKFYQIPGFFSDCG